jgi:predicted RNase H-like HicB family nuclease
MQLTAVYQKVAEGYIGFIEELPGANTQGETIEETRSNLKEAALLVLEANRTLSEEQFLSENVIKEKIELYETP